MLAATLNDSKRYLWSTICQADMRWKAEHRSFCVEHFIKTSLINETQTAFHTHFNIRINRFVHYHKLISGWVANFRSMGVITQSRSAVHHCQREPRTKLTKLVRLYAKTPSCQKEKIWFLSICLFGACRDFAHWFKKNLNQSSKSPHCNLIRVYF